MYSNKNEYELLNAALYYLLKTALKRKNPVLRYYLLLNILYIHVYYYV